MRMWYSALLCGTVTVLVACAGGRSEPPPIRQAIDQRDVSRLEDLLEDGADPDDDSYLAQPMWSAVELSDPRFARLLLEYGADVSETRDHNWTYLHSAARWGHPGVVEALLNAGIDPCDRVARSAPVRNQDASLPDASGMSALDIARAVGNDDVIPLLEEASSAC
jgi:ankyrin repeat protein